MKYLLVLALLLSACSAKKVRMFDKEDCEEYQVNGKAVVACEE